MSLKGIKRKKPPNLESLSLAETIKIVFNTWPQMNEAQHNGVKIAKLFDLL